MKDNDMRWLYRDEDEPEETRVMPQAGHDDGYPRSSGQRPPQAPHGQRWQQSSAPRQPMPQQTYGQYDQQWSAPPQGHQPPPPPPSRPTKQRRRRKRRPISKLIGTLFLLWLLFLVGTPIFAYTHISTLDAAKSSLDDQPGTAVLLVGSDGRDDLSPEEQRRLGTGSTEGRRTDSMMLLYTAPDGKSVILGFPRDSYVEIPGKGKNKLNAAYSFGGHQLLIETIEHNTGIKVDGYLEIGMLGLVDMVDAVGGIEVCPEKAIKDKDAHLDIPAGCQTVDGVTALGYARMRKSDPRGDIGRMERQRDVIGEIVKEAIHPMSFINPVRYWGLNMGAAKTLHRTEDTGIPTMFGAGVGLISNWTGKGVSMTVPIGNANARTKAGSSVLWDEEASKAVFEAIQRGDVEALEQYR